MKLLSTEWAGDRVVVVGDYAEGDLHDELLREVYNGTDAEMSLYDIADDFPYNNSAEKIRTGDEYYAYNHDKKEYVNLAKQLISWTFKLDGGMIYANNISSLIMLLALGNIAGGGGGSYHSIYRNYDATEDWVGDHISASTKFDKRYSDYVERTELFLDDNSVLSDYDKFEELTEDQIADHYFKSLVEQFKSFKNRTRSVEATNAEINSFKIPKKLSNPEHPYYPFFKKYLADRIEDGKIVSVNYDMLREALTEEVINGG